jgi:hypothetical protein
MTASGQPQAEHFSFPSYQVPERFTDTTRQLCGAAYFDEDFANTVIREIVEDERRAVALSFGFDLNPVVRHCFRARRRLIARDAVLFGLVLVGLVVAPFATVGWLLIGLAVWVARSPTVRRFEPTARIWAFGLVAVAIVCCGGAALLPLLSPLLGLLPTAFQQAASAPFSDTGSPFGSSQVNVSSAGWIQVLAVAPIALGAATVAVLFLFRYRSYQILANELSRGAVATLPPLGNQRVARRLATVARAQYGDITVQEQDAFLGSGKVEHGWSHAIPLRREQHPGGVPGPYGRDLPLDQDGLGPALTAYIRGAIKRMREESLPKGARVPGLALLPYIVADGVREQGDPLLDPGTGMPRSKASEEVVEAVIRHPQGGLRYYDRIVISGAGKPIHTGDGRQVLPEQSLGIDISAFVHVAVEGGMLYVEFIAAVMPPVQARYGLVDMLESRTSARRALRDVIPGLPADSSLSGWRLGRGLWRAWTMNWRMKDASEASTEFRAHDYGARVSVRQLAAEPASYKYLQLLDEWKYTKLLERAVLEAVVSFLTENGLETSDLARHIKQVQNIFGDVNNIFGGQQSFGGSNVKFEQRN